MANDPVICSLVTLSHLNEWESYANSLMYDVYIVCKRILTTQRERTPLSFEDHYVDV